MKRTLKTLKTVSLAAAAILSAVLVNQAQAGVIVFTDRTAWEAAIGGTDFEVDLNSYTSDVLISSAVDVGPFSVQKFGPQHILDRIDAPSPITSSSIVDGTTFLGSRLDGSSSGAGPLRFSFDDELNAFGFDVRSFHEQSLDEFEFNFLVGAGSVTLDMSNTVRFFGFVSDTAFTHIDVTHNGPDGTIGHGMDNFAGATVPEPGTLILLALGLLGLGAGRKKFA